MRTLGPKPQRHLPRDRPTLPTGKDGRKGVVHRVLVGQWLVIEPMASVAVGAVEAVAVA